MVESKKYGIKVLVEPGCLKAASQGRLGVSTLLSHRVHHLAEGGAGVAQGEYPFTPIVELTAPDDESAPGYMAPGEDFLKPAELVLPHCFCPKEGQETVVMLTCRSGASTWASLT